MASLFSDEQHLQGLRSADDAALQAIFTDFRPTIVRLIEHHGGSAADGAVFFQTALLDAAQLAHNDAWPADTPFETVLQQLTLHQFHSWRQERGLETTHEPSETPAWLPDEAHLTSTRRQVFVWKSLEKLDKPARERLLNSPDPTLEPSATQLAAALSTARPPATTLPDWAVAALRNPAGYALWQKIRVLDSRLAAGITVSGQARSTGSNIAKYVTVGLMASLLGYAGWTWFNRPKPVDAAVFAEHFDPPKNILDNLRQRYANDSSGVVRPPVCDEVLALANEHYTAQDYTQAEGILEALLDQPGAEACQSDANFFLGVIALAKDDPGAALQGFAKIDNIEAYGEDLYWYQALAFVQIAQHNSSYRNVAERAVRRFLQNTRDEQRRQQAEKMLQSVKSE